MIEIAGLKKRFGANQVLDGVDLAISPGRITAIVGPNAAGKSTLIKCILGLTRPDAGRISVAYKPIDERGAYRSDIGYMPQIARFPENMTAAELLTLARDLRRSGGHPMTIDEELIQHFDVASFARKPLRTLSGGTRQKVNAALAFLFAPSVLMLDEPTAGLDPVASSALKDKILKVRAEHRTVIVTSHVMSELEELADDVAVLVDGSLRFTGTVQEIKRTTRQTTLERAVANLLSTRPVAA
jgi:Cu-processing system ATP-binding protein